MIKLVMKCWWKYKFSRHFSNKICCFMEKEFMHQVPFCFESSLNQNKTKIKAQKKKTCSCLKLFWFNLNLKIYFLSLNCRGREKVEAFIFVNIWWSFSLLSAVIALFPFLLNQHIFLKCFLPYTISTATISNDDDRAHYIIE